ncbi:MAG: type II toxin-antitoxin system VapC family toxin [Deltaproteobacteria bacterium]|nr:type II toxin-antitoxin system VapC family toxin [Deltaproteobacteria bacterium]
MRTCFVDTNLFIRYLTNDDSKKADRVERLLAEAASGKTKLVTADLVIAEIIWVLESAYGMNTQEICPMIRAILSTPGLEVTNASLVYRALEFYESMNIDFIDGYIAGLMEKMGIRELYTFDRKHISRLQGILRLEP